MLHEITSYGPQIIAYIAVVIVAIIVFAYTTR
jgi:hypothetical protein